MDLDQEKVKLSRGQIWLLDPFLLLALATASGVLLPQHPLAAFLLWGILTFLYSNLPQDQKRGIFEIAFLLFLLSSGLTVWESWRSAHHPLQRTAEGTQVFMVGSTITPSRKHTTLYSQKMVGSLRLGRLPRRAFRSRVIVFTQAPLSLGKSYSVRGRVALPLAYTDPGVFSYRRYLEAQGIHRIIFAENVQEIRARLSWTALLGRLSTSLAHKFTRSLGSERGALLTSLLFGHRFLGLPKTLKTQFKRTGIMHIVAASGFHLGMVLLLLGAFGLLQFGVGSFLLAFFLLFCYAAMTGFPLSIQRALFMALFFLYAFTLQHPYRAIQGLFLSFSLLLLLSPHSIYALDFQLSFLSTFAILLTYPQLKFSGSFYGKALSLCLLSLSAFLFTAPIIAAQFHMLPLLSPLAQLLFVPLAVLLFPLALLSLFPPLFFLFKPILWLLSTLFLSLSAHISSLPGIAPVIATPHPLFWLLYYGALLSLLLFDRKRVAFALFLGCLVINLGIASLPHPEQLVMLDVGQGESLIFTTGHFTMVVDGGGASGGRPMTGAVGEQVLIPYLLHQGIKRVNLAVSTHPDSDHIGGLFPLLKAMKVDALLYGGDIREEHTQALLDLAKKKRVPAIRGRAGLALTVGKRAKLTVLHPPETSELTGNNLSLVLLLETKYSKILLPGDIEHEAESLLSQKLRDVDVLQVPHHGSKTSSTLPFLEKTKPEIALISAGQHNHYGHPSPETLRHLREIKAVPFITAKMGCIKVDLREKLAVSSCLSP